MVMDDEKSFPNDQFQISTSPIEHELCGTLGYEMKFDGVIIGAESTPMKYNSETKMFSIWSEDESLIGNHVILMTAFLNDYPELKSEEVSVTVELTDPCLFTSKNSLNVPSLENQLYTATTDTLVY